MGKNRTNNFRSAVRHLKSKQIDERIQVLSERPANSTMGLYTIQPGNTTEPEVTPGDVTRPANFDQDDSSTDTTGLFDDDGTILTIEPPITTESPDRSYILGPMSSMWYAWGNFTQIGYIRESDRKMVNLARITGQLKDWNGSSNFTSYGQLTLEQAVWFRDTPKYLNGYDNYRAFYPGPPSNTPDEFGRYYCTVTGTPKPTRNDPTPQVTPPTQGDPGDVGAPFFGANPNDRKRPRPGDPDYDPNNPDHNPPSDHDPNSPNPDPNDPDDPRRPRPGDPDYNPDHPDHLHSTPRPDGVYIGDPERPLSPEDFHSPGGYEAYKAGGGNAAKDSGKSVADIMRQGRQNLARSEGPNGEPAPELTPAGLKNAGDGKPLDIDSFNSAAEYSAFHAGGGNAAVRTKGMTPAQVIDQGNKNINAYDGGPRTPDYGDFKGPAYGNDDVANKQWEKAKQDRIDALYDYWNDNYVDPNPVTNPQKLTNKQLDSLPEYMRPVQADPNNWAGAFKDTPAGKGFNDFMNDPVHGGWRRAVANTAVDVLAAAAMSRGRGKPMPRGLARGSGFTVGATGVKKGGFDALQGAQNLHKGSKGLLSPGGKGVYSAPTVGQVGPGGLRPGTGAARYTKSGSNPLGGAQGRAGEAGGVLGSVVPPGARKIGGVEPQSVVNPNQFQKGQRIMQRAYDPKYAKTATAKKIRQQAQQAGFGDSPNIPADQLPRTPAPQKTSFKQYQQRATGAAVGVAAAAGADLASPQSADSAFSQKDMSSKLNDALPGYSIGEFQQTGKGDHYNAAILDPNGKPVLHPKTGKPLTIGGGRRGRSEFSSSAMANLTNAINTIKGGGADQQRGQAKGSKKISVTSEKPTTKSGKRSTRQPEPSKRSTIKTMSKGTQGRSTTSATPVQTPGQSSGLTYRGPNINLGGVRGRFRNIRFGDENLSGNLLSEEEQNTRERHRKILREIKQPYVLPEAKKEKYKFKKADKVRAKLGRTINPDMMKQAECPTSFKQPEDRLWGKYEKQRNAKASQDKKNVVLDHLGGTDHVLEYILETGREKGNKIVYGNFGSKAPKKVVRKEQLKGDSLLFIADETGRKESILQSEINDRLDQEHSKELFAMYVEPNKPLYERLKGRITE